MAISRMTKIMIVGHNSEFDIFVTELQKRSILHLADLSAEQDRLISQKFRQDFDRSDPGLLSGLEETRRFLAEYDEPRGFFKKLLTPPQTVKRDTYNSLAQTGNPESLIERARSLRDMLDSLKQEEEKLIAENGMLEFWKDIQVPLAETGQTDTATILLGTIEEKNLARLKEHKLDVDVLKTDANTSAVLVAFENRNKDESLELLTSMGFSAFDLPGMEVSPADRYIQNNKRLIEIANEKQKAENAISGFLDEYERVMILLQYYSSMEQRSHVFSKWLSTENAFIISGWIRAEDREALDSLLSRYETITCEEVQPETGERPPVSFSNSRIFAPFQLITRLYSYPAHQSIDPSPVLSIYFALFFGITLTDAGYGLILVSVALFGLYKFKGGRDILWIIFWGGLFTILAGLLTGGIFGDLFRMEEPFVNAPFLSALRERLIWFDPMKDPMTFFRLVLLLGVIHITTGMVMGALSSIKQKKFADAFVDHISWLVILFSLITVLFATDACIKMSLISASRPPVPSGAVTPAFIAAGIMAAVVVFFGARDEKSLFFRFFIGFLKLVVLSGIFSYLGDILSYIRLMALGMVTAGIGMAVNTIAFLMIDIPVVGIVLTAAVLLGGHLFNLVINLLGGFVHTLRLQYVEFFSKFFTGGGEPFAPLSENRKYIEITD